MSPHKNAMLCIHFLCKEVSSIHSTMEDRAQANNHAVENNMHNESVEGMNNTNDDNDSNKRTLPRADSKLPPANMKLQRTDQAAESKEVTNTGGN